MRRLATWLWSLPWPTRLRRLVEPVISHRAFQRLLVPHFRCGVVGIIQNAAGEYLLFKHTYRNEHPWGLPTGFLEPGEQPERALRREVCEEAGLDIEVAGLHGVYVDERSIVNIVFRGRPLGEKFRPSAEISAAEFYPLDDLPPMMPAQRHLLIKMSQRETVGEEFT